MKDIIGGFKKGQVVSSNKKSKVRSMNYAGKAKKSTDQFGSRSGTDRRKQKYTIDFPERRSGMDRSVLPTIVFVRRHIRDTHAVSSIL